VKEFVLHNFSKKERSKFISLFIHFYDQIILVLKPNIRPDQPLSFFENWTAKIELDINKDNYKSALVSLQEISNAIQNAGYVEEYIRISNLLFINIDWKYAISEELNYFNSQFSFFIGTLADFGKFAEATAFVTKYQKIITGKGLNYIRLCRVKSYLFWTQKYYDEAIKSAREGIELQSKIENKVPDLSLETNLALALRDTLISNKIDEALHIFLNGRTIDELFDPNNFDFISGEVFGNVGRFFQFKNDIKKAIKCYVFSLKRLENEMNKGYGNQWIADCLFIANDFKLCLLFYKNASNIWKKQSPIKSSYVDKKIKQIIELYPEYNEIILPTELEIKNKCEKELSTLS
ncbi:MAG: hypothetical protein WBB31_00340, partial [Saprospiraceae bacterium]